MSEEEPILKREDETFNEYTVRLRNSPSWKEWEEKEKTKRSYPKDTTKLRKPAFFVSYTDKDDKEKKKLNTDPIAEYIKKKLKLIRIEEPNGNRSYTYYYDKKNSFYRRDIERLIIKAEIHDFFGGFWCAKYENDLLKYLEVLRVVTRDEITPPVNLINLNNGIYDLDTKELKKHSSEYIFLYKVQTNYNKEATCPKITKFFKDALPSKEYTDFMQELFGYCLYSRYSIHGFFQFYGLGGNGKAVCTYLLQRLLGPTAVSSKEIHDLAVQRFGTSYIYGKLANISSEVSGNKISSAHMLKALTAGDRVNAEFKGQDSFEFDNIAKIIASYNEMPNIYEDTSAWYDRQYIIPFLKKFRNTTKDDKDLKYVLTSNKQEMEGLLYWAIKGLERLLKEKKFSYPPKDKKARLLQLREPEQAFLDEAYEYSRNLTDRIEKNKVYENFEQYCKDQMIPYEGNKKRLGCVMKGRGITENRDPKTRYWTGIKERKTGKPNI